MLGLLGGCWGYLVHALCKRAACALPTSSKALALRGQALDTLRWPATQAGSKRRRTDSHQPGPAKRPRRAGPPAHTKFRELLEPDVLQVRLVHECLPRKDMQKIVRPAYRCGAHAEAVLQLQLACKLACSHTSTNCAHVEPALARQGATAAAAEAEAALQRQLARKLGIKGAKRKALAAAGAAAAPTPRGAPEQGGAGASSTRLCLGMLIFQGVEFTA